MAIESMLRKITLFSAFTEQTISELVSRMEIVTLNAGQILCSEGEPGDSFYIVTEGFLDVIKAYRTSDERLFRQCGPGTFLGEISMFDPNSLRSATVRASTQATLARMSHAAFRSLVSQQPELAFELACCMALRLRDNDDVIIQEMHQKNRQLTEAYAELQAAQQQIIAKRMLERELQVAREIQESILPKTLPVFPGLGLGALMRPARAVGGDLYDLIPLSSRCLGVMIGDVSDKGVPAAIFMALVRSLLRAEASRMASPAAVLREVNRHLMDMNAAELFVTVIYGILDCQRNVFTFARAGHELPFLFRPDGSEIEPMQHPGQALGLFDPVVLNEQTLHLPQGGCLVLYTDGAMDAMNSQGERFGRERLREAIRRYLGNPAQRICQELLGDITQFQGDTPPADDIALVTITTAPI